jgi:hypothetical protein
MGQRSSTYGRYQDSNVSIYNVQYQDQRPSTLGTILKVAGGVVATAIVTEAVITEKEKNRRQSSR